MKAILMHSLDGTKVACVADRLEEVHTKDKACSVLQAFIVSL